MFVRYLMTAQPVVASLSDSIDTVRGLFKSHGLRRLPVVKNNKFVGLIVSSDIPESASIASDAMVDNPMTCHIDDHIEDVGALMRDRKIGVLPVLHGHELVGIITESDVLDAFMRITCYEEDSKRICFMVSKESFMPVTIEVINLCQKFGMELMTHLSHPVDGGLSQLCMLRVTGKKSNEFIDELWKSKYRVLKVDD